MYKYLSFQHLYIVLFCHFSSFELLFTRCEKRALGNLYKAPSFVESFGGTYEARTEVQEQPPANHWNSGVFVVFVKREFTLQDNDSWMDHRGSSLTRLHRNYDTKKKTPTAVVILHGILIFTRRRPGLHEITDWHPGQETRKEREAFVPLESHIFSRVVLEGLYIASAKRKNN